jgi:hypothetical protein
VAIDCGWLEAPGLTKRGTGSGLRKARFAPLHGGLRPGLTQAAAGALGFAGRDGETALSRTKKLVFSDDVGIAQRGMAEIPAGRVAQPKSKATLCQRSLTLILRQVTSSCPAKAVCTPRVIRDLLANQR